MHQVISAISVGSQVIFLVFYIPRGRPKLVILHIHAVRLTRALLRDNSDLHNHLANMISNLATIC